MHLDEPVLVAVLSFTFYLHLIFLWDFRFEMKENRDFWCLLLNNSAANERISID